MIETVSGMILLVIGALLLVRGLRPRQPAGKQEDAGRQEALGRRFGPLMLGLVLAFLGAALLLPARDATPTPGTNTNPVDEAVEEGSE